MDFRMSMNKTRIFLAMVLMLLPMSTVMASAQSDFNGGMERFRAGDYRAAARLFEAARKQGMESVSLYYNLGSAWYKLGNYEKSRHYFTLVAKNDSMRDLADYNLGLIAIKLDEYDLAEEYFSSVLRDSRDRKLRAMARDKLGDVAIEKQRWRAYVSANYGYDDNITAVPSDAVQNVSDSFYDLFVSLDAVVDGRRGDGWIADARYFRIDFFDDDNYDEYLYGVGLVRELPMARWDTRTRLSFKRSHYAGEAFQSVLGLDVKAHTPLSRRERLVLNYRYEDIASDNSVYDYLQGWRQKMRIEYRDYQPRHVTRIYYELELNDREDINLTTYAASYSPSRHTLRGKYTHSLDERWQITGDLSYRFSDYPATFTQDRDDDRWRLALDADYGLDKTSKLRLRVQHTSNESTVDAYDYDKNVISVGFSKLF